MIGFYAAGAMGSGGSGPVVYGQFATQTAADWTLTAGNTVAVNSGAGTSNWRKVCVALPKSTGKHYIEFVVGAVPANPGVAIGLAPAGTATTSAEGGTNNAGFGGRMQYYDSGQKRANGTYAAYGAAYGVGDVIGIGYDADANTITAYKNGVSQGVMYSSVPDNMEPHLAFYSTGGKFTIQSPMYLPSGYAVWQ